MSLLPPSLQSTSSVLSRELEKLAGGLVDQGEIIKKMAIMTGVKCRKCTHKVLQHVNHICEICGCDNTPAPRGSKLRSKKGMDLSKLFDMESIAQYFPIIFMGVFLR